MSYTRVTVCTLPNRSGRSRQRPPERAIHSTASMKSRLLLRGPRLPLHAPGMKGASRAH